MSPVPVMGDVVHLFRRNSTAGRGKPTDPNGLVLEGWAQGYMVGSLIIMSSITLANMRKGVLLHKLILLELLLGIWHGFWILLNPPAYGWWLSISAIFLNTSWSLHNVIAWMKIKPFLKRPVSLAFIITVILVQPYWIVEIYANFAYFHDINDIFLKTRPWEALCRDPWWIVTTITLIYNIKVRYELRLWEILRISPRFGVMLSAMLISVVFIVLDVLSVTGALRSSLPTGLNPFWKLSFVFKCLTDSVILDDFKTALDRLRAFKISRMGSFSIDDSDRRSRTDGHLEHAWNAVKRPSEAPPPLPSPDGDYVHSQWKLAFNKHKQRASRAENGQAAAQDATESSNQPNSYDASTATVPVSILSGDTNNRTEIPLHVLQHGAWLDSRESAELEYARAVKDLSHEQHRPPP